MAVDDMAGPSSAPAVRNIVQKTRQQLKSDECIGKAKLHSGA